MWLWFHCGTALDATTITFITRRRRRRAAAAAAADVGAHARLRALVHGK
jgi:hypothetical protein